jgi:hypothetical protein
MPVSRNGNWQYMTFGFEHRSTPMYRVVFWMFPFDLTFLIYLFSARRSLLADQDFRFVGRSVFVFLLFHMSLVSFLSVGLVLFRRVGRK